MTANHTTSRWVGLLRPRTSALTTIIGLVACQDANLSDREEVVGVAQALVATLTLQNGTSGYSGMVDAHIREGSPTVNYGSATTCEVDGDESSGTDKSCLMQWDLATLTPGAKIQAASVTVYATNGTTSTYSVHALARAWSESTVTWNQARAGADWQVPGALGSADLGALVGTITGSGTIAVSLNSAGVAQLQRWVNGEPNYGFIISDTSNQDGLILASSEHRTIARRPKLTITYSIDSPGGGGAGAGGASTGGAETGGALTGGTGAGGAATGGAANGGAGSGSAGAAPEPNLLIAFLGDQGNNSNSDSVLNLVKSEGAAAVVHNGDFDYADSPSVWNARIDRILGANYPYFAVVGNHDAAAWDGATGYASYINARVARVPEMQCQGDIGVMSTCRFRGLYMVQSCVGTSELTGHGDCSKDSTEQRDFLRSSLANDASRWSLCLWHKNQHDMQLGTKTDEVGWNAYRECMNGGALIVTGHEHSYSRTLALTDLGNSAAGHGKVGEFDALTVETGRTFVVVSGLGGESVRSYDAASHAGDTWWASQYASNRWMKSGVVQSGSGTYGAMFMRFNVDGNPRQAKGYFKDINGRIIDEFTIQVP